MSLQNYKVTLRQAWNGQSFYNVFNYADLIDGNPYDSAAIGSDFVSNMLPKINDMQHSGVQNISLSVLNTTTGADSALLYLTGTGGRSLASTSQAAPFDSYSFRWRVDVSQSGPGITNIRYGFNRFAGVCEGDVDAGRLTALFVATYAAPLATQIQVPINVGLASYFARIHRYGINWKLALITGLSGVKLGTQNTRKD